MNATDDGISEFLVIASAMGGREGEMWALKAYQVVKGSSDSKEACCV